MLCRRGWVGFRIWDLGFKGLDFDADFFLQCYLFYSVIVMDSGFGEWLAARRYPDRLFDWAQLLLHP